MVRLFLERIRVSLLKIYCYLDAILNIHINFLKYRVENENIKLNLMAVWCKTLQLKHIYLKSLTKCWKLSVINYHKVGTRKLLVCGEVICMVSINSDGSDTHNLGFRRKMGFANFLAFYLMILSTELCKSSNIICIENLT